MDQPVHLGFGGGHDLWIAVSCIDNRNPRETVNVFAAFRIRHYCATGLLDYYRGDRLQEIGNNVLLIFLYGVRNKTSDLALRIYLHYRNEATAKLAKRWHLQRRGRKRG